MENPNWIKAARQGDLLAFNRLVGEHQDTIYNLAYRILCDPPAAEKATQEVFSTAYRSLHTYRRGPFVEWLMRLLVKECKARASDPTAASPGGNHSSKVEQQIEACLLSLPVEMRLVLVLIDLAGLDYDHAASLLDLPPQAIRSRLTQARLRFIENK